MLADIDRLRVEASEIASRVAAKEGQLRNLEDLLAIETGATANSGSAPETPARTTTNKSQRFTDAAVDALTERGAPIHYQELARILSDRDVYIPGKDPAANLIAHMLRDTRFGRGSARGMYGLAGWTGVQTPKAASRRTRTTAATRSRRTSQPRGRKVRSSG